MKIYTRTGDQGTTALISGRRLSKADARIEAYGTVDELNSYVGMVRDQAVNASRRAILKEIQDRLFTIGSHLADDPERHTSRPLPDLWDADVTLLEQQMDEMDAQLPLLRQFVLPGGHPSVSFAHLARTVCRRAERLVVALSEISPVEPIIIQYLNRLSDYFFVLSRHMAQELQVEEVTWVPRT
ncbi:ATP:cob(I)alamin adenosyltransferase [Siphonobacter sp. BAB-5405]|uniref:cob(I)yrinic acid a,c-diamide adenosyltransferase n=1 Tax=Siphonobacter sp. BAB-5405 TaxID=1864825 RepID=UPI000C80E568|nr:cob(I)yrinic acid a,c-diamide adenosyltransferase [Siphonobacter sp. BAB-5405]PMD97571.1 ATP:cob(I)alamin adenosyltransferase [Siphonobacter sp. BAB-5405]